MDAAAKGADSGGIVPLSRAGSPLGVERIQVVDTVTGRVVVDTPVQR